MPNILHNSHYSSIDKVTGYDGAYYVNGDGSGITVINSSSSSKYAIGPTVGDTRISNSGITVYDGSNWVPVVTPEINEISERNELHERFPQLKELWDEYLILRKLLSGR